MQPSAITVRRQPKEAIAQLERVVIEGDLAFLTDGERVAYYARVCESLGLNPLTRPFEYIRLNQKLTLYARKDATDQLRKINGVSVERLERERDVDLELAIVTAYGRDRTGRTDSSIGAVSIKGLAGEGMANALMKAETKAKRRLTLSLAGLGWLDEVETDSPLMQPVTVDPVTGEIETTEAQEKRDGLRDRIASRTAAIRGESTEESDASSLAGGAVPGESSTPPPAAPRKGDPWMRRLHAVASERGMDHDALHDWAVEHFGVESLSDLTPPQRATFMELVERMEVMPSPEDASAHATPAGEDGAAPVLPTTPETDRLPAVAPATGAAPVSPAGAAPGIPTDEELLAAAGPGAELVPPEPGTDAYKALPAQEKAAARAYWQNHKEPARPTAEQLQAALTGGES
jgi:hypothetical protein